MKYFRSRAYIEKWFTLTKSQKNTLRLIRRRQRWARWEKERYIYWWARLRDYTLAALLIFIPTEIVCFLIYLIGRWIYG